MSKVSTLYKKLKGWHLSLKTKLTLALSAICVILLISCIISILEYRSMSSYVSSLIASDVNNINVARELMDVSNTYNLEILKAIGEEDVNKYPDVHQVDFFSRCDSLKTALSSYNLSHGGGEEQHLVDSVLYSYAAYMLTSQELQGVILSDYDTKTWYLNRLQPKFARLRGYIDAMSTVIYSDLQANSKRFDRGFYRSIIPGIVAVGVGLLLVLMLLFFMLSYYVNPLYRMLDALRSFRLYGKNYTYTFEGDDQLSELNDNISDIAADNQQLHKRIASLRKARKEEQTQD